MTSLANTAWLASSLPGWMRFRQALAEPEKRQREILRLLLTQNAESAYGQAHRFSSIRTYEEYRERVSVVDYDGIEPWIARIRRGESGVLTREPATRLLPTSGSTAGRKLIPFTVTFQRQLNSAIGPWLVDLFRQQPTIARGPAYWSISPALPVTAEASAVPIGFDDDSAYLGGLRQRLVEAALAVPSALRLVSNLEDFRYLTLLCLLRQRGLCFVSVWHPSFLTLLLDTLPTCWDELLRDVAHGDCMRAARFPMAVRQAVSSVSQARRAAELRQAGPANPQAFWPHLRLVSCWADAQAAWPARDLQSRWPHVVVQSKGLLATEAVVSIPFRGLHPVALRSHFYEFADQRGVVKLAHELQSGESYRVIVTTGGGLWRYQLGDLVEVDGFVEQTPSLRFLGRGHRISDCCGEKLAESFVTRAIEAAYAVDGPVPRFAMLAPEQEEGRWRYTLFIEGEPGIALARRLDTKLRDNPHYALCRDLGQLGPLRIHPLRSGAYAAFCAAENRRLGDTKPQSLSLRVDWRRQFRDQGL